MAKPISTTAPYATMQDPPTYEKRAVRDRLAPWEKDQSLPVHVRGLQGYTASQMAPYGNANNQPPPRHLTELQKTVFPPYATEMSRFRQLKEVADDTPRVADLQRVADEYYY